MRRVEAEGFFQFRLFIAEMRADDLFELLEDVARFDKALFSCLEHQGHRSALEALEKLVDDLMLLAQALDNGADRWASGSFELGEDAVLLDVVVKCQNLALTPAKR